MKKRIRAGLSVLLCASLMLPSLAGAAMAIDADPPADFTIVSPYADIVWSGDGAWGAYKGNLHTHSFVSDAQEDYRDMILEFYNQGNKPFPLLAVILFLKWTLIFPPEVLCTW